MIKMFLLIFGILIGSCIIVIGPPFAMSMLLREITGSDVIGIFGAIITVFVELALMMTLMLRRKSNEKKY
jgi:hypothetical protein